MLKSIAGIVGVLLLASASLAPARAGAEAPARDVADVEFTVAREGEAATTFELSDCEVHVRTGPGSTATYDIQNGVTTVKGDAIISALRGGRQVFFMSVKNALITLKSNTAR